MSWLSRLIHAIFDGTTRPVPPVKPPPPPNPPPVNTADDVTRALAALNARRAQRGAGPLALDSGLMAAALELVIPLGQGKAQPHEGFPERVRAHGWPYVDKGIRNRGFGNVSEGITWGGRTPEEAVLILDSSPLPSEGHRRDFEDPAFTHVGIAFALNAAMMPVTIKGLTPEHYPRVILGLSRLVYPDGPEIALVPGKVGGLVCIVDYGAR